MARRGRKQSKTEVWYGPDTSAKGGTYQPLSLEKTKAIADAAIEIMCVIGFSECPEPVAQELMRFGCHIKGDRNYFTDELIN